MRKPFSKKPKAGRVVRRTLADGTVKEYRYGAWQGKPAKAAPKDSIRALLRAYEASQEWAALSPNTQQHYLLYLRPWLKVAEKPVATVTRRDILDARDAIASTRGTGAATAFGRAAAAMFAWAVDRDWIPYSPAYRIKPLPRGSLPAWSEAEIAAALAGLPEHLRRVTVLALYTGQRRGDLCAMTWAAYDGATIRLRQQKTGTALVLPVHPNLKAELDGWKAERSGLLILSPPRGLAWAGEHLSHEMAKGLAKLGLPDRLNVHGLRKAAARRLAEAGCSAHEIAAITGHRSLSMVQHYTDSADQERLAGAAVARLQSKDNRQKGQ